MQHISDQWPLLKGEVLYCGAEQCGGVLVWCLAEQFGGVVSNEVPAASLPTRESQTSIYSHLSTQRS